MAARVAESDWGAHASRVLATASRRRGLWLRAGAPEGEVLRKDCFGVTPKPTRETRALPRKIALIVMEIIQIEGR
jgi:hypothetical protein